MFFALILLGPNYDVFDNFFPEVEEVGVRSGIMMVDVQRRLIPLKIISLVQNTLLIERLSLKTSLPVGATVLVDFWLLPPLIVAQIYFELQF